jgi:hypothetical protein
LNQAVTFRRQRPARKTPSNGAGGYLDVKIGDSGQDGNDCHAAAAAMYCSPRSFWTDMIFDRKASTCRPVE